MGTSSACMFATLYYALHERLKLLPTFESQLEYLKRFIDDMKGIWTGTDEEFEQYKAALKFGSLEWTVSDLSNTAIFLDLEITIGPDRRIITKTYEKPMNLFLYIPPKSAHPPGVLKSIVYGNLQRFWRQNTYTSDYICVARKFAQRLIARGHSPATVQELFMEAAKAIDRNSQRDTATATKANPLNTLFFHWEFHPRGLQRQAIREAYNETKCDEYCGFSRFVIAYHRPQNLQDAIIQSRVQGTDGNRESDIFDRITGA